MPKIKKEHLYVAPSRGRGCRRFPTPQDLLDDYIEYCKECDTHTKTITKFDEEGQPYDVEVRAPITHTEKGFCLWAGINQTAFRRTYRGGYGEDKKENIYSEVIALMDMDIEQDVREKFETGELNSRLAGLWMSRYDGYSTKQETEIKGGVPVVISGDGDLED